MISDLESNQILKSRQVQFLDLDLECFISFKNVCNTYDMKEISANIYKDNNMINPLLGEIFVYITIYI